MFGPPRPAVQMDAGARVWGEYGSRLIARLANDLTPLFGREFSRQNLQNMRLFHLEYPLDRIRQTVSGKSDENSIEAQLGELFNAFPLPWSAYVRLQSVKNVQAREFYETEALRGGWSVRQLSRQIDSQFYERTALSRNKEAVLAKGGEPRLEGHMLPQEAIKEKSL